MADLSAVEIATLEVQNTLAAIRHVKSRGIEPKVERIHLAVARRELKRAILAETEPPRCLCLLEDAGVPGFCPRHRWGA